MINERLRQGCLAILQAELRPALGCTEPIAVAYAAAKARETLERKPETVEVCCSGNIIKNVKGVFVPNSGGMKGIPAAALLGVVGGRAQRELEVLEGITEEDIQEVKRLLRAGICKCSLRENLPGLYIQVTVHAGDHSASVTLKDQHTNIIRITRDGETLFEKEADNRQEDPNEALKKELSIEGIVEFAETADLGPVRDLLEQQIAMNTAISEEGLQYRWGAAIGKLLLERGQDVRTRAKARAAAGSDARMGGCPLPVVINSGSGNQGITATMPVITYAEALHASRETLYRALLISDLVAIHQKAFIGSLSAYCGAVCAAAGSGAAITYLRGGTVRQIGDTVINTVANIGGMICDGAKASCAAKIASAVEAAILGSEMSLRGERFCAGDGIVKESAEETVRSMGRVGKEGMRATDLEILGIMLEE